MQVLKFCLPKESISEQLDSGYIDTRQRKESNKISGNYFLTVLFDKYCLVKQKVSDIFPLE